MNLPVPQNATAETPRRREKMASVSLGAFSAPRRLGGLFRPHRRGLGLAELLISLTISAMLLTAMAVAIDASFKSYQANEEQSTLTQRARLALYRMLMNIRTTSLHQPYSANQIAFFASGQTVTDTGLSMYDNNNNQITYMYDAPSQQLRMIEGGATHVMLNGVTSFQVTMQPMKSANAVKTGSLTFDLLERAHRSGDRSNQQQNQRIQRNDGQAKCDDQLLGHAAEECVVNEFYTLNPGVQERRLRK